MSTTTKIFIVLVCLFAFLFTPLTIQFAARVDDWKGLVEEYRDFALNSQVHNRNVVALSITEKLAMEDELEAMTAQLAGSDEKNVALQRQLADLSGEKDALELANRSLEATVNIQTAANSVKAKENQELAKANTGLREHNDELMTRNIGLNDTLKEMTAKNLILEQKRRMLEEENLAIRDENRRFREMAKLGPASDTGAVGPMETVQAEGPVAASPIRGEITQVEGGLAEINVGSADGVSKDMVFVVMRNARYLGDLRVNALEPGSAVGVLELTGQGEIKAGDLVRDKNSLENVR